MDNQLDYQRRANGKPPGNFFYGSPIRGKDEERSIWQRVLDKIPYLWSIPITELQRIYHAEHGNGPRGLTKTLCRSPGCTLLIHHKHGHSFEISKAKRGVKPITRASGASEVKPPRPGNAPLKTQSITKVMVAETLLQLQCSYIWAIPITERQRLYHAIHGNGGSNPLVSKISTEGLPKLRANAQSAEEFIEWELNLRGWCSINGCDSYVLGPAPAPPPATEKEKMAEHVEKLALGLRYVCAALENPDLKSAVAINGKGNGPEAFKFLQNEFLQGTELQPALNLIIDSLRLKPGENPVPHKARFQKFVAHLDPKPHANILCAKYAKSITGETNNFYDDCVTSAQAVDQGQSNFNKYAALLTQLCSQIGRAHV